LLSASPFGLGCVDARGVEVTAVLTDINDLAQARIERDGRPLIEYTKRLLKLPEKSKLFFYAHECGHHVLAHLFSPIDFNKEQQADCWAVQTLHQHGLIDQSDLPGIQQDLGHIGRADDTHIPGMQRAQNLKWCLTELGGNVVAPRASMEKGGFPQ